MSDPNPPVPPPRPPSAVPPASMPPVPGAPTPPAGPPWGGYAQPTPYSGYPPAAGSSGKAVAVLVLGITSLVIGCLIGLIPAIIALSMAGGAKREIAASGGRLSGEGLIKGGVICSWISIGLSAAFLVLIIGLIALGAFSESNYQDTGPGIQSSIAWLRP